MKNKLNENSIYVLQFKNYIRIIRLIDNLSLFFDPDYNCAKSILSAKEMIILPEWEIIQEWKE